MNRSEALRRLIQGHVSGDESEFRSAALQLAADEKRRNNQRLAGDLLALLDEPNTARRTERLPDVAPPLDRERQAPLFEIRSPDRRRSELILRSTTRTIVDRIIDENASSERLRIHGLKPARRMLFCGPPGTGKTVTAEVLASELSLPMIYVRFDAVVSSLLGETSANLRRIFEYAQRGRWIVFFDEFDAIGKSRDDESEHGEMRRVVNTLLQLIDSFESESLVIAATNYERSLDYAMWRRFDEVVQFPLPTIREIKALIELKLRNYPNALAVSTVARRMSGMSHADVEHVCVDSIKSAILDGTGEVTSDIFSASVDRQKNRLAVQNGITRRRK